MKTKAVFSVLFIFMLLCSCKRVDAELSSNVPSEVSLFFIDKESKQPIDIGIEDVSIVVTPTAKNLNKSIREYGTIDILKKYNINRGISLRPFDGNKNKESAINIVVKVKGQIVYENQLNVSLSKVTEGTPFRPIGKYEFKQNKGEEFSSTTESGEVSYLYVIIPI